MTPPMKVAVLAGGESSEREVSLVSGRSVFEALTRASGYEVFLLDPAERDWFTKLKNANAGLAFVALHGGAGENGAVQKMLEEADIPFTGSGSGASRLAFDKATAQTMFRQAGIRVPEFRVIENVFRAETLDGLRPPLVVKPSAAGSSVGITIVNDARRIEPACEEAFRHSSKVIVERYIAGRELTVGILGETALPVGEIIPRRAFYDYEAKYGDSGTRYEFPARLAAAVSAELQATALRACRVLGCEAMGRADFMLDADGLAYALEVNTIPGLTPKSLLPKAALAAGIDFTGLCVRIMEHSLAKTANSHGKNL